MYSDEDAPEYEDDFEESIKKEVQKASDIDINEVYHQDSEIQEKLDRQETGQEREAYLNVRTKGKSPDLINYRPNDIFKGELQVPKKTLQYLNKENAHLRNELNSLSQKLSILLDEGARKKRKTSQQRTTPKSIGKGVVDKKLLNYELEQIKVKEMYEKFNNVNYLMNLKNEVKIKEEKISQIEKELKVIQGSIDSYQKDLDRYEEKAIPEDKVVHRHLVHEYMQVIELIDQIEKNIEKMDKKSAIDSANEKELQEKLDKLMIITSKYTGNAVGEKENKLYQQYLKKLEKIQKSSHITMTQMKIHEKDLKNEIETYETELKKYKTSIKSKSEILNQVRKQLEEANSMASSTQLDKLAILLASSRRPSSGKFSVSPRYQQPRLSSLEKNSSAKHLMKLPLRNFSPVINTNIRQDFARIPRSDSTSRLRSSKEELKELNEKLFKRPIEKQLPISPAPKVPTENSTNEKLNAMNTKKETNLKIEAKIQAGENYNKVEALIKTDIKKSSVFEELEGMNIPQKGDFLKELEGTPEGIKDSVDKPKEKRARIAKPSLFDELESGDKNSEFNRIDFGQLNDGTFNPSQQIHRPLFLDTDKQINPIENYEISATKNVLITMVNDKYSPKAEIGAELFSNIQLSNPKEKRNRDHLIKNTEKKSQHAEVIEEDFL